jgi:hypothetical protein
MLRQHSSKLQFTIISFSNQAPYTNFELITKPQIQYQWNELKPLLSTNLEQIQQAASKLLQKISMDSTMEALTPPQNLVRIIQMWFHPILGLVVHHLKESRPLLPHNCMRIKALPVYHNEITNGERRSNPAHNWERKRCWGGTQPHSTLATMKYLDERNWSKLSEISVSIH